MSQRKKDRQNERNRLYNSAWKSQVRTYTKRFLAALAAYDKAPSEEGRAKMAEELAKVYETADKCQVKGVMHRNTAPRGRTPPVGPGMCGWLGS